MIEIEFLDAQAESLEDAEAGAVEEAGDEADVALETGEDGGDLSAAENDGEFSGDLGTQERAEVAGIDFEDVFAEEDEGVEGLVLGGGGDAALGGQPVEDGASRLFGGGRDVRGP